MLANEDNVINRVSNDNKVDQAKTKTKSSCRKNQNRKTAKFKFFVKPNHDFLSIKSSVSGSLALKAKLTSIYQIETSIYYTSDPSSFPSRMSFLD